MKKYYPLIFILPFLVNQIYQPNSSRLEFLNILVFVVLIFVLFEYLDRSRDKRIEKLIPTNKNKVVHIIKYGALIGLLISFIINVIIINHSTFIHSVIFIIIPLTLLFSWIGLIDWKECYKKQLEQKYFVKL